MTQRSKKHFWLTFLLSITMVLTMMPTVAWADDDPGAYVEVTSINGTGKYILATGDDNNLIAIGKTHVTNNGIEKMNVVSGLSVKSYDGTKYIQPVNDDTVWECKTSSNNYYFVNSAISGTTNVFYICSDGIKYHYSIRTVTYSTTDKTLYSATSANGGVTPLYAVVISNDSKAFVSKRFDDNGTYVANQGTPIRLFKYQSTTPGPVKYTVTYNANGATGGAVPVDSTEYEENAEVTVLGNTGNLVKTGYTFDKWKDGDTSYNPGEKFSITKNTSLTAVWLANNYTVQFEPGFETEQEMNSQAFTYDVEQTLTNNSFVRDDYTFSGWECGTKTYSDGASVKNLTADKDGVVTLTAKWTRNNHFVKVDKTTGHKIIDGLQYIVAAEGSDGKIYALKKTSLTGSDNNNVPTKEIVPVNDELSTGDDEIQFTSALSDNKAFFIGKSVTSSVTSNMFYITSSGGLKYQGTWSNGGYGQTAPRRVEYQAEGILAGYEPNSSTSPKYVTFDANNHTFGSTNTKADNTKNIILFKEVTCSVRFDLNGHGSSGPGDAICKIGEKITVPSEPTDDNYDFEGWYTDPECKNKYDFDSEVTSDFTLYANWTAKPTYKVEFDLNDIGSVKPEGKTVVKGGKVSAPEEPTAEGFSFGGWFTESGCTNSYDFNTPVTGNLVLYAKWTVADNNYYKEMGSRDSFSDKARYVIASGTDDSLLAVKKVEGEQKGNYYYIGEAQDVTNNYNGNGVLSGEDLASASWLCRVDDSQKVYFVNDDATMSQKTHNMFYITTDGIKYQGKGSATSVGSEAREVYYEGNKIKSFNSAGKGIFIKLSDGVFGVEAVQNDDLSNEDLEVGSDMRLFVQTDVFIVSFNMNGHGTQTAPQTVISEHKVEEPNSPSEDGWEFGGWFTDKECTEGAKFDFDSEIVADTKLYAKWTEKKEPTPPTPGPDPQPTPTPTPTPVQTEITLNTGTVNAAAVQAALNSTGNAGAVTTFVIGSSVKKIGKNAFAGTNVNTLIVKSKKLKAKTVKGSLKGSNVSRVKVKIGSKKTNKKYVKKYKKIFTKKKAGKKAKVGL